VRAPRLLPLIAISAAGVLAVKGLASVQALPSAFAGARAWGEEAVKPADAKKDDKSAALPPASKPPAPVCAPTAAELAKQAGLSPAELQLLQSLGVRRGQLDQRDKDFDTQLALMAAAEGKLDAKIRAMQALKGEVQGMLGQAETQKTAELTRLVTVYQAMKPRDAAARMTLLADDVRLPIAARMKERPLSAILAQMPPAEAKALTEKLAARYNPNALAEARARLNGPAAAPAVAAPAQAAATPATPVKTAAASPDPVAATTPAPAKVASNAPAKRRPAARPKPKAAPKVAKVEAKPEAAAQPSGPKPYASLQPAAAKPAAKPAEAPAAPAPSSGNTSVPIAATADAKR
jgi:flagellar motility protein MotE (MotC chaperone)